VRLLMAQLQSGGLPWLLILDEGSARYVRSGIERRQDL